MKRTLCFCTLCFCKEFCKFIQQSWYKRAKLSIECENPNDVEIYIYLFAGAGTRYLSGLAGQFLTFQPGKIKQSVKWYPVLTTKTIPETKSLSFLGKTKLPIGLLLLVSYENTYLYDQIQFNIQFHMTVPLQIQCLLFILSISPDNNLHRMIGQRLTAITLCDENPVINVFTTSDKTESLSQRTNITIRNFFPDYLCFNSKDPIVSHSNENHIDAWNSAILSLLMKHNWTKTSDPSSIQQNNIVEETQTSSDSSQFYGKRSLIVQTSHQTKKPRHQEQQVIFPPPITPSFQQFQPPFFIHPAAVATPPPPPLPTSPSTSPMNQLLQVINTYHPSFNPEPVSQNNQQVQAFLTI